MVKAKYPRWDEAKAKFVECLDMAEMFEHGNGSGIKYDSDFKESFGNCAGDRPYYSKWSALMLPFINATLPHIKKIWDIEAAPV